MNKLHMANPFYKDLDSPDERKEPKSEESVSYLEGLLKKYEESLEIERDWLSRCKFLQTIDDILTPKQINAFLQLTIMYEEHKRFRANTGDFISKFIQNSYDAGYNDFVINTKALKEITCLGKELKGKKSKLIEITIEGNIGGYCGFQARHSTFHIEGNAGDECGIAAKYSNFKIKGNTGERCGSSSEHSNFKIQGNAGISCGGGSRHSNFYIEGSTGHYCGIAAKYSNFKIKGNTGYGCGRLAEFSNFNIKGNTGGHCGGFSKHSNFKIKGNTRGNARDSNFYVRENVGGHCGFQAEHSNFEIHGDFGKEIGGESPSSSYCTFITYKPELYKRLLKELSEGNKAILKDKKGNIIEEKII